jgi:hypothetical protein
LRGRLVRYWSPEELASRSFRTVGAAFDTIPPAAPFSPVTTGAAFFMPLLTRVRGKGVLRSSRHRVALQMAHIGYVPKVTNVLECLPVRAGRGPEPRPAEGGHPRARGASGATGCRTEVGGCAYAAHIVVGYGDFGRSGDDGRHGDAGVRCGQPASQLQRHRRLDRDRPRGAGSQGRYLGLY